MLHQRPWRVFYQRALKLFLARCVLVCLLLGLHPPELWAQSVAGLSGKETVKVISLLVEEDLYQQTKLKPLILRYAQDVQKAQNAQVLLTTLSAEVSPFEIYEGLARLYFEGLPGENTRTELMGVVLVGNLPLPVVEKGGNLWPTVFPYTDFYQPNYLWNETKNRFVYQSGNHLAPEIWHGLIRSSSETLATRVSELERFFETNHTLHQSSEPFGQQVFMADLVRQKKMVPSDLFWRYQEWIEFAEEVQYLRYTKHWLRRLFERAAQAGIDSANLSALSETEKQALADEILAADNGLSRTEVLEALNNDSLIELPDNFAKQIIDNLAKRYWQLYENWLKQVNTQVERSGRWQAEDLETLPALVSQKDEASVLQLRFFNDELETALLAAVNTANVPHDVAMHHTVPVTYTEVVGEDENEATTLQPAYWNGVLPSDTMTAEDCTLLRGRKRDTAYPFAQLVEANRSMDIDTSDSCKNAAEPDFNSDPYEGCCARNITYANQAFGYNTCQTGTDWQGGDDGLSSLFHVGAEQPVFSYRGTREISGEEGANGCRAGFAVNEAATAAGRFSSLMKHDEPRPEALMQQVQAQFTRALPVDDPRGFSFLDHGETFHRLDFPNVFTLRQAVANAHELEISVRNILQTKIDEINAITSAGNATSNAEFTSDGGSVFPSGYWPAVASFGSDVECDFSEAVQSVDTFTRKRIWTRDCESFVTTTSDDGSGGTTSTRSSSGTFLHQIERFYETGALIPDTALDDFLARFDFDELYEALAWIDLDIEAKNRQALSMAMSNTQSYNDFFAETDFNGYELVQIIGEGSAQEGLEMAFAPEDFDPDFEFLEARGEEAEFVFAADNPNTEFLGEDFANTFQNAEEEKACDRIPNTTLFWPARLVCSLTATTKATTKNVSFGPNLGTTKPLDPVIENLEANLDQKRLVVTPTNILTSTSGTEPITVQVQLLDEKGDVQTTDFSTEVTLEFDSRVAEQFFTLSPAQSQSLLGGKATFVLVPKPQTVGSSFSFQAVARNVRNPGQKLSSQPVAVKVGRYRLWASAEVDTLAVADPEGTVLKVKVLDENGFISRDWEGENLRFTSPGGAFADDETAVITNGVAQAQFFPGTVAGDFDLTVQAPSADIPSTKVGLTLLPDDAVGIKLSKKSPYLIAGGFFRPIGAQLIDQYNNVVEGLSHQWSWDVRDLEVENLAGQDADLRARGIQMLSQPGKKSQLSVRPVAGKSTAKIGVVSDFLQADAARGLAFKVVENPELKVTLDKPIITAGQDETITATVEARTQNGELITDDFILNLGVEPLARGRFPAEVTLVDGQGRFTFSPGNLAGNFKLRLSQPGFQTSLTEFRVQPGPAAKVDLRLLGENPEAVNFAADQPIELQVQVFDAYQNWVPNWGGQISLRATEATKHLVDIDTSDLSLSTGKQTIEIQPKNLSGTVRLIAEHEDLTLGTLTFRLTSFFRPTDISQLAPQSLLTLLLGWETADLRQVNNFANRWLLQHKAGAVVGLGADKNPAYQYGYVAPDGTLGPRLEAEWVSAEGFNALLTSENKRLAQAKRFAKLSFAVVPENTEPSNLKTGLWWKGQNNSALTVENDGRFRWQGQTVLQVQDEGGLHLLDQSFHLQSTNNLFQWELWKGQNLLGNFYWHWADEGLEITENFIQNGALQIKLLDPEIYTDEALVGNATNGPRGYVLLDSVQSELQTRKLGSLALSIENENGSNHLAWGPDWGIAAHLAAGESLGKATQLGASDILVVYGDPSLKVRGNNQASIRTDFTQDIGQPLFTAPEGGVKNIFTVDVDEDGQLDVLTLTGDQLWVNRQLPPRSDGRLSFGQAEPWLHFPGGVKQATLMQEQSTGAWQILQLDFKNTLVAWEWTDGKFVPHQVLWPETVSIESFQSAILNNDGRTDLVVVDNNHSLWQWMWAGGKAWAEPIKVYDFPPNFGLTNESLEAPGLNLKLGFISYQNIEADELLAGRTTKVKTNPDARPRALQPDELDQHLLGSYFDPAEANPNQVTFVALEEADFLTQADYSTESFTDTITPGSRVAVELKLQPNATIDQVQILLPSDEFFTYVPDSLNCVGCGGTVELRPSSASELFWARLPRLNQGQTATLTWELEVEKLRDLLVWVGDFDDGHDQLDDIAVPWDQGDDPLMLYFLSGNDESENPVAQSVNDTNQLPSIGQSLENKAAELFGSGDPDGDGIPASHDHYPTVADGATSIANGLLPGMLTAAIGGRVAGILQGGGSCFFQTMSKAKNAPGLATSYNPPHATPGGKSGGKCATCLKNFRSYIMPTTSGKVGKAACLGKKRPHMASPAWTPNCFVSTPPVNFTETCPAEGAKPEFNRLFNNASGFSKGSLNFQIPGNFDAASLNAKLETLANKLPAALTSAVDRSSAWVSQQFEVLNRGTSESGPSTERQVNAPSFSAKSATNYLQPQAGLEMAENKLSAGDTVHITKKAVPVLLPNITALDLKAAQNTLNKNKAAFEAELQAALPAELPTFQKQVKTLAQQLPDLARQAQSELSSIDFSALQTGFSAYEKDLKQFANQYKTVCLSENKKQTSGCQTAKKILIQAQGDLKNLQILQGQATSWQAATAQAQQALSGLAGKAEVLSNQMAQYGEALGSAVAVRQTLEGLQQSVEENFANLETITTEATEQILSIREQANKVLAATVQSTALAAQQQQAIAALENAKQLEWATTAALNRARHEAEQGVRNVFNNFALAFQTDNVTRGTLLHWLSDTSSFVQGDFPVTTKPAFAHLSQDNKNHTPGRVEATLPIAQIETVDVGNLPVDLPPLPEVADDFSAQMESLNLSGDPSAELAELKAGLAAFEDLTQKISAGNWFPRVNLDGTISGEYQAFETLPGDAPDLEGLSSVANLDPNTIPASVGSVSLPALEPIAKVPKIIQPALDPAAYGVKIPIHQGSFTPPPPLATPIVGALLETAEQAFDHMSRLGTIMIGAAPVSEWYVKPQVEHQTGRNALDSRDIAKASLQFNRYAEVAQNINIKSASPVTKMFNDFSNAWEKAGKALGESLSFPDNEDLPKSIPGFEAEPIQSASLLPSQAWQAMQKVAWQYQGQRPELAAWESWVLGFSPQKEWNQRAWLQDQDQQWQAYLTMLEQHQRQLAAENQTLRTLAAQDAIGFWQHPQVVALMPETGRHFTAETTADLNFSLETRDFITENLDFIAPAVTTANFAYFNAPSYDQPSNNATDLVAQGVVSNDGDGDFTAEELADLKNAGLKPGMYYAQSETLGADVLHHMPFFGKEAQAAADFDDDGQNEILYTLRQRTVYLKQRPSLQPDAVVNFNLKQWSEADFLAARLPIKQQDSTPFLPQIQLEVEPFASQQQALYEWVLRPGVDKPPQQIHGAIARPAATNAVAQKPLAQVQALKGTPQVEHRSNQVLESQTRSTCLALPAEETYFDDAIFRAGPEKTKLWVYQHPLRGRAARQDEWLLEPGQEIRFQYVDACVLKGIAYWQSADETLFTEPKALEEAEALSDGSVLRLGANDEVEVELFDGQTRTLKGPLEYYWHRLTPGQRPDLKQWVALDHFMTYHTLRTWRNSEPSIPQPLTPHPGPLPW